MTQTTKTKNRPETPAGYHRNKSFVATKNACKLCTPLGAALVFKGIDGAVPLLHGSQGCSTYIRRYMISHFKEPIDIACSNFSEETAVFGGGMNLKTALANVNRQYDPKLIGVATTCLSETIGDDVPMFIREYISQEQNDERLVPPIVQVSTPSYQGTHVQGFHAAVKATVIALNAATQTRSPDNDDTRPMVNIFPGMGSPADLRYLKEILTDFGLAFMMLPDYSQTLDGELWTAYQRIPPGGTPVETIRMAQHAQASIELGSALARAGNSAGVWLEQTNNVPCHPCALPIGIHQTDRLFQALKAISGRPIPEKYLAERGRLIDSYADGHKHVMSVKAVLYGEEDLVIAMASFLSEIGVTPVLCASGDDSGYLAEELDKVLASANGPKPMIMENADFVDIEAAIREISPDIIIGNSKGYAVSRKLDIPLLRIGFPIHDRVGGARRLHYGYRGAQSLFDDLANTLIEKKQASSSVGYTYM